MSELPLGVLGGYCELMRPLESKDLRFKKLSDFATAPIKAINGSVGYDLYSVVNMTIFLHNKGFIATDITLSCPIGLYLRIAPRSSMAMKNTNVGVRVVDFDYRGNVKVVILNHSKEKLSINREACIAQFILTRYETPSIIETDDLDKTICITKGFGSSGV